MRRGVWVWLMLVLAGCAGQPSVEELIQQLKSNDLRTRVQAIRALEKRKAGSPAVVQALADALNDGDLYVRRDAALALGQIGPAARAAVPSLQASLRDKEGSVRDAAARALKKIDPGAAPPTATSPAPDRH